ncbi:LLM class F420-dependent oxidoreductase [Gandjariella thermophila]|uniref:LLM class F420-dependent oxidoreductase n=1 Tax=Gandjariella thermophila TaxID=1931992 RepID=A0A4D4J702_9PSEU|nr:LLM class F420-dependent oxidoreductase [Gandjariella thermophila]
MRFGIATFVTDEGIRPAELGRAVEERGFDSLFLAEHTHIPTSRESPYPGGGELPRSYYRTLDPFVSLTAAAVVTERLLLGTGIVLLSQRDPIITAKEVASLDLVSNGRVVFGVGAGWNREEMRNHGTDPRTRGALVNERLAAIRRIWTEDEAEFHGRFVDFDPIFCWPKPVRRPHPPIYVGGDSPAAYARVAEHGSAWLPNPRPNPADHASALKEIRERAGRDVPFTVYAAPNDPEVINGYAELGAERILLYLPTRPRDETLRELDELAATVAAHAARS